MCFRLDPLTTRGTKSLYIFASTNDLIHKHNSVVAQATRKLAARRHDTKGRHAGTICELARDFRESRTTDNTALAMKRPLARSRACSSRLSTLLIANACCSPSVCHSFVLKCCACCRDTTHQQINSSPALPKALASSSPHLKLET